MTSPLVTPAGACDRAAIFAKAWRNFRRVRAAGDCGMCFGDWLANAWRVARAQRLSFIKNSCYLASKSTASAVDKECRDPGCTGAAFAFLGAIWPDADATPSRKASCFAPCTWPALDTPPPRSPRRSATASPPSLSIRSAPARREARSEVQGAGLCSRRCQSDLVPVSRSASAEARRRSRRSCRADTGRHRRGRAAARSASRRRPCGRSQRSASDGRVSGCAILSACLANSMVPRWTLPTCAALACDRSLRAAIAGGAPASTSRPFPMLLPFPPCAGGCAARRAGRGQTTCGLTGASIGLQAQRADFDPQDAAARLLDASSPRPRGRRHSGQRKGRRLTWPSRKRASDARVYRP